MRGSSKRPRMPYSDVSSGASCTGTTLFILTTCTSSVDTMSFKVGPINAERGEKVHGYLDAAEMPLGKVSLPVTVINGREPGKALLVMAGIHATEYPGMRAAQRLAQEIEPGEVTGTILILHCANPQMFNAYSAFVNPVDSINFNRIFPGKPTFEGFYGAGTVSHHITNRIYTELMTKATHFMDLHAGDLPELLPFYASGSAPGDPVKDEENLQMLRYTLADFIGLGSRSESLSTTGAASRAGIPNVIVEAGGAGLMDPADVERHYKAVTNVARYLGILPGDPEEPVGQRQFSSDYAGVRARRGGFFESHVTAGEYVEAGQHIGTITDIFGKTLEKVASPITGIVQIIHFPAAKHTGDPLYSLRGVQ